MNRTYFITTLWIILVSLLVSYLIVAYMSGNWNLFQWETKQVEDSKFIGGAVVLVLFIVFRKKLKTDDE